MILDRGAGLLGNEREGVELEDVGAGTSGQRVVPRLAVERVIAGAADERVVAAEAGEDVVAAVAGDDVVAVVPGAIGVVVDRGGQVIDVEALVLPAGAVMRLAGIAGAEQHAVSQICGSVGVMILVERIRTESR